MKTRSIFLKLILCISIFISFAQAADRTQIIQSKIHSTLSSILPKTDFLIIVNRTEDLDSGMTESSSSGAIKMLPGLNVGVDSKGTVINQNQGAGDYQGAISITVIIDNNVKNETYQTLQKVIPDLIGGVREDDEIKISKSSLRQVPVQANTTPTIQIQNQIPENKTSTQDQIKFLSIILVFGGLLFWLISKFLGQNNQNLKNQPLDIKTSSATENNSPINEHLEKVDFSVLDPNSVGLFLMKQFKNKKDLSAFSCWVALSDGLHQREVFKHLPAWILDYFRDQEITLKKENNLQLPLTANELFHEISLTEQSLKTSPQKQKAFLMWFPAEALRFVPRQTQASLTEYSKRVLWNIRPDLGNFVKMDVVDIDSLMSEVSENEISECLNEIQSWSSKTVEQDSNENNSKNQILRWKGYIDSLTEFGPIDSQLKQAKEKMTAEQFQEIYKSVAHLNTPLLFNADTRKDWLRTISPDDFFWWQTSLNKNIDWDLKNELRPLRYNMFMQASENKNFESWSEKEKKIATQRILNSFKQLLEHEDRILSDAV
jgi:hypothetical protein